MLFISLIWVMPAFISICPIAPKRIQTITKLSANMLIALHFLFDLIFSSFFTNTNYAGTKRKIDIMRNKM